MSRSLRVLLVVLLAIAGAAVAVPASAAPTSCATAWGSTPESAGELGRASLVEVRTGRHACWDRVVFELRGPAAGYSVEYVNAVIQDGSGFTLPVPGGARLQVQLRHPSYDAEGATYTRAGVPVAGYSTLRSVVNGGSFEGYTTFGVGTRARLPFRVFTLTGPGTHSRIVLDVAHRW